MFLQLQLLYLIAIFFAVSNTVTAI